jgi:hypothetical protein
MRRNLIGMALIVTLTGGALAGGLALIETSTTPVAATTPAPNIFHYIRQTPEPSWHPPMLPPRPTPTVIPTPVPVSQ